MLEAYQMVRSDEDIWSASVNLSKISKDSKLSSKISTILTNDLGFTPDDIFVQLIANIMIGQPMQSNAL
jgi:hypothetical protein